MSHDEQDVSIPAPGISLVFARHYESSFEEDVGMGIGWLHTYSHYLEFGEEVSADDYERITWTTSQGNRHEFRWNGTSYVSPDELHGKLTRSGTEFLYREKDGTRFRFDADGKLLFIKDRNGNMSEIGRHSDGRIASVTAVATTAQGVLPRKLSFTYTPDNKIEKVSDDNDRAWVFDYDEFANPDNPAQTDHFLVSMKSPARRPVARRCWRCGTLTTTKDCSTG